MIDGASLEFITVSNVKIQVVDMKNKWVKQTVVKHNKATRNLVTGILRFMSGQFTPTNANPTGFTYDSAKNYIPCYVGFGDGGVQLNSDGLQQFQASPKDKFPVMSSDWNSHVNYTDGNMIREINCSLRQKFGKIQNTWSNPNASGDIDSIIFECKVAPGTLNVQYGGNPIAITELGLFPTNLPNTYDDEPRQSNDMLAYIKLSNEDAKSNSTPNTLYVIPQDTIFITWNISLIAVGNTNVYKDKGDVEQQAPGLGVIM